MKYGERALIEEIVRRRRPHGGVLCGIGDDCAVVDRGDGQVDLWTMDTLLEGVHFDFSWHAAELVGRKAVAVNVSDIAAMGGTPTMALLSLGVPSACSQQRMDSLLSGLLDALAAYDVELAGGDTVSSRSGVMLTLTLVGTMAARYVRYRSMARERDDVWVSGNLGDAACGLELCRRGMLHEGGGASLIKAHCDPLPQVALGRLLAASGLVHAMMDLSDGIATDLAHICAASGVGARIEAARIPMSSALRAAASCLGLSPLALALAGGEDYQLVFTVPADKRDALQGLALRHGYRLFRIGSIVAGSGLLLREESGMTRDICFQGYEHRF